MIPRHQALRQSLKRSVRLIRAHLPNPNPVGGPVLVNSIPKAGTNLLKNIVKSVPGIRGCDDASWAGGLPDPDDRLDFLRDRFWCHRPGCFYTGHIPYARQIAAWLDDREFRHLFMMRDPRDVIVSVCHYIMRDTRPRHPYYDMYARFASDQERLMAVITGFRADAGVYRTGADVIPSIASGCEVYMPWAQHPGVLTVRFEDLVGQDASAERVREVLARILRFLDVPVEDATIDRMQRRGMSPRRSYTFRRGRVGSWRDEFTEAHVTAFQRHAGDLVERMGYRW